MDYSTKPLSYSLGHIDRLRKSDILFQFEFISEGRGFKINTSIDSVLYLNMSIIREKRPACNVNINICPSCKLNYAPYNQGMTFAYLQNCMVYTSQCQLFMSDNLIMNETTGRVRYKGRTNFALNSYFKPQPPILGFTSKQDILTSLITFATSNILYLEQFNSILSIINLSLQYSPNTQELPFLRLELLKLAKTIQSPQMFECFLVLFRSITHPNLRKYLLTDCLLNPFFWNHSKDCFYYAMNYMYPLVYDHAELIEEQHLSKSVIKLAFEFLGDQPLNG